MFDLAHIFDFAFFLTSAATMDGKERNVMSVSLLWVVTNSMAGVMANPISVCVTKGGWDHSVIVHNVLKVSIFYLSRQNVTLCKMATLHKQLPQLLNRTISHAFGNYILGCDLEHGFCYEPDECFCHTGWSGKECSTCVTQPNCPGTCAIPAGCVCSNVTGVCSIEHNPPRFTILLPKYSMDRMCLIYNQKAAHAAEHHITTEHTTIEQGSSEGTFQTS